MEEQVENINTDSVEVKEFSYGCLEFHPLQEKLVDILTTKTGMNDRSFFRIMVAYKFAECASNMRANIEYVGSKNIPTNVYALDLAPSGYSKNASMNILEKEIFREFKDEFMLKTFPKIKDRNLADLAADYEVMMGISSDDAYFKVVKEFELLPKYIYSFGASTPEGFKGLRSKLSMAGIGSTSNVLDEIGSNLTNNKETLTVQLESYDTGDSKQKLIKVDSNSDIKKSVPSNLFAFGTQSKLLDGGAVEKEFFEFLETGYARRFIVGFVENYSRDSYDDAEDIYNSIMNPMIDASIKSFSSYFKDLSDESNYNIAYVLDKDTTIELIKYRVHCDKLADSLKDHEELLKAVIKHAYWRALKVAGAYAFVDKSTNVTKEHIYNAIALVEESITCFKKMLTRKKPYERLAEYIANVDKKVTQVDLVEDLGFYKGSEQQKRELLNLAIAYGYNNNIIIKRTIKDGIEFLEGESLKKTSLDRISCSWSKDITEGYKPAENSFDKLYQLVCSDGFHYCNHRFKDGYRKSDKVIEGFNLLMLDVDSGLPIETCKKLLSDYSYLIATTKRHTEKHNRYRVILPMNYELKLNAEDYKKFMKNVFAWLPFDSDEQTSDIARKWQSHKGEHFYNSGKLFDVLPFIPDTSKEEKQKSINQKYEGVENLQRWFLMNNRQEDGRNNMLRDYALAMLDNGMTSDNVRHSLYDFNDKLDNPLSKTELESTIMKTVIRKEIERENANG